MNLFPSNTLQEKKLVKLQPLITIIFFVAKVTGHEHFGTENLTSKLYLTVEFDDGDIDSFVPLHDLLFVEGAKNGVLRHQPELDVALKARKPIIRRSVSRNRFRVSMRKMVMSFMIHF